MTRKLCLAQDPAADELLAKDPFALLTGMLLDQQIPMEKAFKGPKDLADRMGGLDILRVAEASPDVFAEVVAQNPAIHRFPASMAKRLQALAKYIVKHYDGKVESIWKDGNLNGKEVLNRLKSLPGFGDQKARIFLALLGKQMGVQPEGWREASGAYGEVDSRRSVADVVDPTSLGQVREFKKASKAAPK